MAMRKRKGSGRPRPVYPPYAAGPEQMIEEAMKETVRRTAAIREAAATPPEQADRGAAKKEKTDPGTGDGARILLAPDLWACRNGMNEAALRRETDSRGYYSYPMKLVSPDAMHRLIRNTGLEYIEKSVGMLQIFRITYRTAEAMAVADRYSGVLSLVNTGDRMEDYDGLAGSLIGYFAAAGIIEGYSEGVKVLSRDEAGTDPVAEAGRQYPSVWYRGAWPEDIDGAKSLAAWYRGLARIYVTPAAADSGMPREVRFRNVFGGESAVDVPLADSDPGYSAAIVKAVLDADRMFRSATNSSRTNAVMRIDPAGDEEYMDITSFPLFRKPAGGAEAVPGPFMTDMEGLAELLSPEDGGGKMPAASAEELEEAKKQLRKAEEESRVFARKAEKAEQELALLRIKAEKESEELSRQLREMKDKLSGAESEGEALKAKVAEYAGLLRDQKDTDEYEQILKASEDENAELKKKAAELQAANEALKNNFEMIKRKDVKGEALITRGGEKDFFMGEVRDFILSAVAKELSASVPNTRRAHVLQDILDSNGYGHLLENKKARIKAICEEYDGDLAAALPALDKEGYYLKSNDVHPKVEYYGDPRYTSVVSSTASDHRSWLNQISDMSRMCL